MLFVRPDLKHGKCPSILSLWHDGRGNQNLVSEVVVSHTGEAVSCLFGTGRRPGLRASQQRKKCQRFRGYRDQ